MRANFVLKIGLMLCLTAALTIGVAAAQQPAMLQTLADSGMVVQVLDDHAMAQLRAKDIYFITLQHDFSIWYNFYKNGVYQTTYHKATYTINPGKTKTRPGDHAYIKESDNTLVFSRDRTDPSDVDVISGVALVIWDDYEDEGYAQVNGEQVHKITPIDDPNGQDLYY